uniref:C2H2-type domain-containing protein n=1 Tax=Anopheles farauti TaxID=69004 RepID=A0A182QL75_9DIPT
MADKKQCTLCLCTDSNWFLEVFNDDNRMLDIADIVSKHLWFDLKPSTQPNICSECWTSVHDFHLFYTKLESVHNQDLLDVNSIAECALSDVKNVQLVHEHQDDRLQPAEHDAENQSDDSETNAGNQSATNASDTKTTDKKHFVVVDEYDENDDDYFDECNRADDDYLANSPKTEVIVLSEMPAKRGRGRPPKRKPEQQTTLQTAGNISSTEHVLEARMNDSQTNTLDQPVKRRRGRPPKIKPEVTPMERNDGSTTKQETDVQECVTTSTSRETPASDQAQPIKRGRGRPPKIKSENGFQTVSATKLSAVRKRKSTLVRRDRSSSSSAQDDDPDFDGMRVKKKTSEQKKVRNDRDERIFQHVTDFSCEYCVDKVFFKRFIDADRHYKLVHNEPGFLKCPKCDKKCHTTGMFLSHMETHEDPDKNKCHICGKQTDCNISLKKHMRIHQSQLDQDLPFPCSICKRKFESEEQRIKHEKCEVCKEIYQNLDQHMIKAHTPHTSSASDKKYKCDQCGRMFNFLANLKMHIDCIHGSKDIRCNICNKYFNLKAFQVHKRTAHTDQMLMCEHCPKMFKTRSALEAHKSAHDDSLVQFTTCKFCNKQLRLSNVKKHMKNLHSEEGPSSCELCGKTFRSPFHMKRHQKNSCEATINMRKHKCEICGKGFCLKLTMIEHMTTHTRANQYQCAFCFKSFGYISNLYKHRKKAHPLEWQEVQARPEEGIATVIVLKPSLHPYVCTDCWTSVYDFHQFYTRLENVYNQGQVGAEMVEVLDIEFLDEDAEELRFQIRHTPKIKDNDDLARPNVHPDKKQSIGPDDEEYISGEENYDYENNDYDNDSLEHDESADTSYVEDEKKSDKIGQRSTIAIDIMDAQEQPVKRRRGRPPKRKLPEDEVQTSSVEKKKQNLNATRASSIVSSADQPVKRGRGRPPKQKPLDAGDVPASAAHTPTIKKEIKSEFGDSSDKDATPNSSKSGVQPERRSTRVRKVKYLSETEVDTAEDEESELNESDMEECDDPEYEEKLELQRKLNMDDYEFYEYQCNMESEQFARDNRIFQYVDEFICHYCVEKVHFKRFAEADVHYRVEHKQPPFLKCPKCDKKCHNPGMFISHMETHDDPEKSRCHICGKLTDCNISLKKHMRVHQGKLEQNLPYPCSRCKRKFETEEQRDKHEKLHVPKPFVPRDEGPDLEVLEFYKRIFCDICEEGEPESTSFDNLWALRTHMANEHRKSLFVRCPVCFKRQINRTQVIAHIDMHKNPDKYRCEVCQEVHQDLPRHMMKTHTPNTKEQVEKKYECEQCGRMFNYLTNLKMHIDCIHGLKDVRCNICDNFNYKAYQTHKRKAHTDQMLMCEHCPRMFKNRKALEAHKGYHDASLLKLTKCDLCGKQIRACSMSKHMKTMHSEEDPIDCELCGKTFRTSFHMKRHQRNTCEATMDSRTFKCEVCGKGFCTKLTMVEHMTTHTRANQYQCAFCFKSFGYISNLYKHRKKAHPLEWQEVQQHPEEGIATVIVVKN